MSTTGHIHWFADVVTELVDPRTTEDRFAHIVKALDHSEREAALIAIAGLMSGAAEESAERANISMDDYMTEFRVRLRQYLIEEEATND